MARTVIELRAIEPERPNFAAFRNAINQVISDELDEFEKLLHQFTGTWSTQPKWNRNIKRRRADAVGRLYTHNRKFAWIEEGTKRYYARMSRGFVPKTKPGRLRSGPGSGGRVGPLRQRPISPGIKARNIRNVIKKERQDKFARDAQIKLNIAAQSIFGGGSFSFRRI